MNPKEELITRWELTEEEFEELYSKTVDIIRTVGAQGIALLVEHIEQNYYTDGKFFKKIGKNE